MKRSKAWSILAIAGIGITGALAASLVLGLVMGCEGDNNDGNTGQSWLEWSFNSDNPWVSDADGERMRFESVGVLQFHDVRFADVICDKTTSEVSYNSEVIGTVTCVMGTNGNNVAALVKNKHLVDLTYDSSARKVTWREDTNSRPVLCSGDCPTIEYPPVLPSSAFAGQESCRSLMQTNWNEIILYVAGTGTTNALEAATMHYRIAQYNNNGCPASLLEDIRDQAREVEAQCLKTYDLGRQCGYNMADLVSYSRLFAVWARSELGVTVSSL